MDIIIHVLLQQIWHSYLDQGPEFGSVVFKVVLAGWAFIYPGVKARDGDIGNSNLGVMAPSNFDEVNPVIHLNDVDDSDVLEGDAL